MAKSLIAAVVLVACSGTRDPDRTRRGGTVTLNASGATFQKTAQEVAIEAFTATHKDVRINYSSGGSGKGRQDFADRMVDFACTDAPYKKSELGMVKGGAFFYIPNLLGAITLAYNVPGVGALRLSAPTIAQIFQLAITRWNDPAIAAENPGVALPDLEIVVARRADGSGTTENFTKFLVKAAPGVWRLGSGSTVRWPADTEGGTGNGGVAHIIKSTEGAIGYVDLSDAKVSGLAYASIKNAAGRYIEPTAESVTAAGDGIDVDDDLLFSAVNARGDTAYPITAQSWCLVYANQPDRETGALVKAYFEFLVTGAQPLLVEFDFAPIPPRLRERALARIAQIEVP